MDPDRTLEPRAPQAPQAQAPAAVAPGRSGLEQRVDRLERQVTTQGASLHATQLLSAAFGDLHNQIDQAGDAYADAYDEMAGALKTADERAEASRTFLRDVFVQAMGSFFTTMAFRIIEPVARDVTARGLRALPRGEVRRTAHDLATQGGELVRDQATERAPEALKELIERINPAESTTPELPGVSPRAWLRAADQRLNAAQSAASRALAAVTAQAGSDAPAGQGGPTLDPEAIVAEFARRTSSLPPALAKEEYARMMWQRWLDSWKDEPRTLNELDTTLRSNATLLAAAEQQMKTRQPIDAAIAAARRRIASSPPPDDGPIQTRWRRQHAAQPPN